MADDLFNLRGRRALVTGSSRGIGRAIVLALAERGADVVVHGASSAEEALEVARQCSAFGATAHALLADLSAEGAAGALYRDSVDRLGGPLDVLVINAAVEARRPWAEVARDEFDFQVGVNMRSSLELAQAAVPAMIERGWGRVLAIGSVQQVKPHRDLIVYAATKQAQLSMVRNLARQVADTGVTVNNLAPGVIETDMNAEVLSDPEYSRQVLSRVPAGRFGKPQDCVGAALLLCSNAGAYITGADLFVDGGMSLD